ncbi:MFS transporter [Celeribacter persicus]|uniref:Fucose permease n=1 Tax=Celeribacter persicus TaxID=1651082 RepID=A0A2T5HLP0_9RHOB|nr:MFS transporter [Celeribacter persicus]PTQ72495.1 fucose permease [Celeribacter persicus]
MIDLSVLRLKNFRLLFASASLSNLGDGVIAVALPWLATLLTSDPVLIGLVAAARQAPWFVLSLPAGVITDRIAHARVLILCDTARFVTALLTLALALLATPGPEAVLLLAALAFTLGSAEVLRDNTAQSFIPALVPEQRLESANGLLWASEQAAGQLLGPPLAGVLIALTIALPFGFQAAGLLLAVLLVSRIARPTALEPRPMPAPFVTALKEGLAWLWHHAMLRRLAIAVGAFNFTGAMFWAIFVLYAQDVLGLDALAYGLLLTSAACGGVAGSLLGPAILKRTGPTRGLFIAMATFVLTAATLALSASHMLVAVMLAAEAFTTMMANIAAVTYRQRTIPAPLLGRVNAAYRFFGTGLAAFGALAGGVALALAAPLGAANALHLSYGLVACGAFILLIYGVFQLRLE